MNRNTHVETLPFLCGALILSGCLTIETVNISQKTTLERQLMGTFEPLSEKELLLGSVRAQAQQLRGDALEEDKRALSARQRQIFNRDDVHAFKKLGCMGEAFLGNLVERPCDLKQAQQALLVRILEEESADRKAIISWVISQHDHLEENDRLQVSHIYRQFILRHSPDATPVQSPEGTWTKRISGDTKL